MAQPLTKSQLDKMTKPEVVQYCLAMQETLFARVSNLEKAAEASAATNSHVESLVKRIELLESHQVVQASVTRALSREVQRNGQYLRKDTIEVHGVDESISGHELESKVCALLSMSGESVTPQDLHACHRLSVKTNVICKFKCRKRKHQVVINKRKIQDSPSNKNKQEEKEKKDMRHSIGFGKIWINESLSNHFRSMQWKCRMLLKEAAIESHWFFNGHLCIKLSETGKNIEIVDDEDLERATGVDIAVLVKRCSKPPRED